MQYVSDLNNDQILQAMTNSLKSWGNGKTPAQATEKFLDLKNSSPSKIVSMAGILDPNGNVAASLKRYHFKLASENGELSTVGIGAVFTREEFRNRGFAQKLIQNILSEAKNTGCQTAILFSDIDPNYYAKFGFKTFHDMRWVADAKFLLKNTPPLKIRSADDADTEKLMQWYENSFPKKHLRYLRPTPEVWKFLRRRAEAFSDYIVSFKNQDVGYFNANAATENLWVHEYVLTEPSLENEFAATLGHFSLHNDRETVAGWLRPDTILNGFVGRSRGKAIPMICPLVENLKFPQTDSQVHFSTIDHI